MLPVRMLFYGIVGGIGALALFLILSALVADVHFRAGFGILHISGTVQMLSLTAGVAFGVWWAIRQQPSSH